MSDYAASGSIPGGDPSPVFGQWYPIETAPKDGTPVLMTGPYEETSVVAWRGNQWACLADGRHAIESQCDFGTDYISLTCATHWTPLPAPPVSEDDGVDTAGNEGRQAVVNNNEGAGPIYVCDLD